MTLKPSNQTSEQRANLCTLFQTLELRELTLELRVFVYLHSGVIDLHSKCERQVRKPHFTLILGFAGNSHKLHSCNLLPTSSYLISYLISFIVLLIQKTGDHQDLQLHSKTRLSVHIFEISALVKQSFSRALVWAKNRCFDRGNYLKLSGRKQESSENHKQKLRRK